jgi:hypothetical protein
LEDEHSWLWERLSSRDSAARNPGQIRRKQPIVIEIGFAEQACFLRNDSAGDDR